MGQPAKLDRVVVLVLVLGAIAMLGVRLHVLDDDFPNPDIAGIVYNAELILDGGRPYVDTVEIKPPGAFLWAAISTGLLGRSLEALQLAHLLWLALGGLGVWWAARALYDRDRNDDDERIGPRCAAVATATYLVSAAMFTYNYSSWMTPASALAVGMALRGLRRGTGAWSVGAGAMAMLAFVTIQRAATLGVVLPGLWWWARRRGWSGARLRAPAGWLLGAGLALLPLGLWYADARGELGRALFPVATGLDYAAAAEGSVLSTVALACVQLVTVFWFPVGLVTLAGLAAWREPSRGPSRDLGRWIPGLLWLIASMIGAGLGGLRFYVHYLVQYAPALALLAGHPALVRAGTRAMGASAPRFSRVVLTLAVLLGLGQLVEIGLGQGHRYEAMARRLEGGQTAAQAAGAHIRRHSAADAPVLAWGWTAWRVYYWSRRRSPSRIYKPLGSITTFNTNTAFDSGTGLRFRDGPYAAELIEAFDRDPPAYFVYSPSMVQTFGAQPDPLYEFGELARRIERDYWPEAQFGDLVLHRRRVTP
ncbi:MAG: hypothetical protein AAGF11_54845 [Myxococcota bacterium]